MASQQSGLGLRSQYTITTASCISKKKDGKKQINQYVILNILGQGKFAKVKKALNTETRETFAVKIINKAKMKRKRMSPVKT